MRMTTECAVCGGGTGQAKACDCASKRFELQRKEFEAMDKLAYQFRRHNMTAVVDDDYPQVRHEYESALAAFIEAMKANGRFDNGNRYKLMTTVVS